MFLAEPTAKQAQRRTRKPRKYTSLRQTQPLRLRRMTCTCLAIEGKLSRPMSGSSSSCLSQKPAVVAQQLQFQVYDIHLI